jgi:hypothetical protein
MPDAGLDVIVDFHAASRRVPVQFVLQHLSHPLMAATIVAGQDSNMQARWKSSHRYSVVLAGSTQ